MRLETNVGSVEDEQRNAEICEGTELKTDQYSVHLIVGFGAVV
jgi:hypothetical protein